VSDLIQKLSFLVWIFLFGNVALAIGQGPREMDIMRTIIVVMFSAVVIYYKWPQLIPKKLFAGAEIALWGFMMVYAVTHKMTFWVMFGVALAFFIGSIFLATYFEIKAKKNP